MKRMKAQGFLSVGEASRISDIPPTTLRSWAETERVRSCRVGDLWFLEIKSLRAAAPALFPKGESNV